MANSLDSDETARFYFTLFAKVSILVCRTEGES